MYSEYGDQIIFEQNLDFSEKNPGHNRHFSEKTGHYHIWSLYEHKKSWTLLYMVIKKTGHLQILAKILYNGHPYSETTFVTR